MESYKAQMERQHECIMTATAHCAIDLSLYCGEWQAYNNASYLHKGVCAFTRARNNCPENVYKIAR